MTMFHKIQLLISILFRFSVDSKALSKYVAMIYYAETFRANIDILDEQHESAAGEYQKTFNNWNKIIFIISKSLLIIYMNSVLIFAMIPLAFYLIDGELVLAIDILLPFLDPTTERTFHINLIFQIYCLIFACAGMSAIDSMFVFYSFQALAMVRVTRMSFKEFGRRLNESDEVLKVPLVVKSQLRQVLQRYLLMQK